MTTTHQPTDQPTHSGALRIWRAYTARIDATLRRVEPDTADDLRRELLGHLHDAYAAATGSEAERVDVATARLGAPEEFLRPLLADRLIDRGTQRFAPVTLARGLGHEIARGGRTALVGLTFLIGHAMLAGFVATALAAPLSPRRAGLFTYPNGRIAFGVVRDTAGATEAVGLWTVPIALAAAALLWWLLGRLLRRVRAR